MELNEIKEELYKFSKSYLFNDSIEYISNKVDAIHNNDKYELMDNIFYSIDLNKLNAEIAAQLIEATRNIRDKLVMRKFFIENCKNQYPYKKDRFAGLK